MMTERDVIAEARAVLAAATSLRLVIRNRLSATGEKIAKIVPFRAKGPDPLEVALVYSRGDARAIALAVRALGPLLDVLAAADNHDGCTEHCRMMAPYRGCTCGGEDMQAAIDRALAVLREAL